MTDNLGKVRFTYLDYLFKEMYSVKSKHYPDSTFFKNDDKVVMELEKSGTLWVLYSVWSNISDMFSFDYNETQRLIKEWMEAQLKLGEVAPDYKVKDISCWMEEQLKSREVTPLREQFFYKPLTEERLKSEEVTPLDAGSNYLPFMEKQLKQEEVIPHTSITNQLMRVQEELKSVEIEPIQNASFVRMEVEEELKSVEFTPYIDIERQLLQVEEQLKSVEIEPVVTMPLKLEVVEGRLKSAEVTPRNAIAPPSSWRNLKSEEVRPHILPQGWCDRVEEELESVKYAEIKPISNKFVEFRNAERRLESEEVIPRISTSYRLEERLESEEITPRQVVPGSFDWVQEQIIPEKTTRFIDSVR